MFYKKQKRKPHPSGRGNSFNYIQNETNFFKFISTGSEMLYKTFLTSSSGFVKANSLNIEDIELTEDQKEDIKLELYSIYDSLKEKIVSTDYSVFNEYRIENFYSIRDKIEGLFCKTDISVILKESL